MPRKTLIQHRRDTQSNWTAVNPTLASGEIGVETDTNKFKIGDGTTVWSALAYQGGSSGADTLDGLSDVVITSADNGDILAYDSATSNWKNVTPAAAAADTLDGLSDVVITSAANGNILAYDSATSNWKNVTPAAAAGISFSGSYSGTTWNVVHNLGYRPAVTTTDNALTPNVIEGTVVHINANSLTVTFTSNVGGTVYLS